jgi:plastocyanin
MAPAAVGLVVGAVALTPAAPAAADSQQVTIVDNEGRTPNQGIDAITGDWGFAPMHIAVTKGDMITFVNPDTNKRNHDVVAITRTGSAASPTLEAGTPFTSGSDQASLLKPDGSSWQLDTSTLDPGHYSYFCSLHPWMLGSITVLPNQ